MAIQFLRGGLEQSSSNYDSSASAKVLAAGQPLILRTGDAGALLVGDGSKSIENMAMGCPLLSLDRMADEKISGYPSSLTTRHSMTGTNAVLAANPQDPYIYLGCTSTSESLYLRPEGIAGNGSSSTTWTWPSESGQIAVTNQLPTYKSYDWSLVSFSALGGGGWSAFISSLDMLPSGSGFRASVKISEYSTETLTLNAIVTDSSEESGGSVFCTGEVDGIPMYLEAHYSSSFAWRVIIHLKSGYFKMTVSNNSSVVNTSAPVIWVHMLLPLSMYSVTLAPAYDNMVNFAAGLYGAGYDNPYSMVPCVLSSSYADSASASQNNVRTPVMGAYSSDGGTVKFVCVDGTELTLSSSNAEDFSAIGSISKYPF